MGSAAVLTGARGGSGPLPEWGAGSGPVVALRPCGHMAAPDLPPCGGAGLEAVILNRQEGLSNYDSWDLGRPLPWRT